MCLLLGQPLPLGNVVYGWSPIGHPSPFQEWPFLLTMLYGTARHHFHTMMSSWGGNGIPGFFLKLISHEKGTFLVALLIHRIFGVRQRRGTNPQTLAKARKGTQILLSMTQAEPGNLAKDEKQQPALCNT